MYDYIPEELTFHKIRYIKSINLFPLVCTVDNKNCL